MQTAKTVQTGWMPRLTPVFEGCTGHIVSFVVQRLIIISTFWIALCIIYKLCLVYFASRLSCSMTKPTQWHLHPVKTQISLGIRPVWSESLLSAWRKLGSLATHWAHSEDWSDWGDAHADLSLRWAHSHFVGFVMRRLRCMSDQGWHITPASSLWPQSSTPIPGCLHWNSEFSLPVHSKLSSRISPLPLPKLWPPVSPGPLRAVPPMYPSLSTWRNLGSLAIHWMHSKDSDQTGWSVFAGCTGHFVILDSTLWLNPMKVLWPSASAAPVVKDANL